MAGDSYEFVRKIANSTYEIVEQIGTGGFGVVFLARKLNTEVYYALKVCSLRGSLQRQTYDNEVFFANKLCNNKRTIRLVENYTFNHAKETFGVLCYERMEIDLMDYVLECSRIPEEEVKIIFYNLCKSVAYMHMNDVAHLDLKPENILLNFANDSLSSLKLCDFGFTKSFVKGQKIIIDGSKGLLGTKEYRAPEIQVIKKRFGILPKQLSFYPDKADIWSIGICLYVALTGYFPYRDRDASSAAYEVDRLSLMAVRQICEDDRLYKLISRILTLNPLERPTIEQVLEDDWFEELRNDSHDCIDCIDIDRVDVDKTKADIRELDWKDDNNEIKRSIGDERDADEDSDSDSDGGFFIATPRNERTKAAPNNANTQVVNSSKRNRSKSSLATSAARNALESPRPNPKFLANSPSLPNVFVACRSNSKICPQSQLIQAHWENSK